MNEIEQMIADLLGQVIFFFFSLLISIMYIDFYALKCIMTLRDFQSKEKKN